MSLLPHSEGKPYFRWENMIFSSDPPHNPHLSEPNFSLNAKLAERLVALASAVRLAKLFTAIRLRHWVAWAEVCSGKSWKQKPNCPFNDMGKCFKNIDIESGAGQARTEVSRGKLLKQPNCHLITITITASISTLFFQGDEDQEKLKLKAVHFHGVGKLVGNFSFHRSNIHWANIHINLKLNFFIIPDLFLPEEGLYGGKAAFGDSCQRPLHPCPTSLCRGGGGEWENMRLGD